MGFPAVLPVVLKATEAREEVLNAWATPAAVPLTKVAGMHGRNVALQ